MSVVSNNILAGASGQGGGGYEIERSLRFNSGDSAYLNRSPSSAGNRRTWTLSFWIKRSSLSSSQQIFVGGPNDADRTIIRLESDNTLEIEEYTSSSSQWRYVTTQLFRDISAWYSVCIVVDTTLTTASDRVKLFVNGNRITQFSTSNNPSQNYQTRINSATSHFIGKHAPNSTQYLNGYLADVHFIDGQALAATDFGETDDNGVWQPKEFAGTYTLPASGTVYSSQTITNENSGYPTAKMFDGQYGSSTSLNNSVIANQTNGTYSVYTFATPISYSSSVRIYGDIDTRSTNPYIKANSTAVTGPNAGTGINGANKQWYTLLSGSGTLSTVSLNQHGGYVAAIYAIEVDGTVLVDGTSAQGANSFHLDFKDNSSSSALGNDAAGSNNWTVNNLSVAAGVGNDSLVDTPTNGDTASDTGAGGEITGNYAVMNPLNTHKDNRVTLANGNLQTTSSNPAFSSFLLKSGKWYCEHTVTATGYNLCFSQINHPLGATPSSANSQSIGWYTNGSTYWGPAYAVNSSASYAIGDVLGAGIDMDNSTIKLYKNGSLVTTIDFSTGTYHRFTDGMYISQFNGTGHFNFGQRAFAHTAPSGYKALCTANLPEPTIADGSKYFDTKLYTGDGNSSNAQTGLNFSPDFAWVKPRSAASSHNLYDTIRGDNKRLVSNATSAEQTVGFEFQSNGFDPTGSNDNGTTYATWAWDAGSSNTTIAAGSLNSSAYDQSQTWSSGKDGDRSDYPVTNVFDASLTTVGYGSVNQTITVTLPGGSIALTSLRVRADRAGTATGKFYVNGNDYTSQIASGTNWNTITGETSITSIGYASDTGSNFVGLYAVEVNGKQLVDYGVSVPNVPSIASTVRANPSAGFSIVSYTGNLSGNGSASVAHGLNAIPALIITKRTNGASRWTVQHKDLADNHLLVLDTTDASTSYPFGDLTNKTSSIFSTNYTSGMNTNGDDFLALCFAPVEGYSAMGIYEADGSNDNVFIYTGFRPRWIILKRANSTDGWLIFDTARDVDNVVEAKLEANTNAAENTSTDWLDIVSNGFKIRSGQGEIASSGSTYIYMSFAEHPFKTARAR